ncbi:MAG: hypothetical protein H8E66_27715 [Planctomycetes bacterium]|nr:hypothetical protein [Planctomycetota bacterium]
MLKQFRFSVVLYGLLFCHSSSILADDSALDLFKRRITPILRAPNASSCTECHLSGVDLRDYIGETQEETFASLRLAGLIDMDNPDQSKLLRFIKRTPDKPTPIGEKVRKQEYEAFRAWIHAAVKDPKLAAAKTDNDQLGPAVPLEVIRHTRQDRVMQSFVENIWSEMGRCVSCHSPELNRKKIGRNGFTKEDVDAISWVVPRDPAATLQELVDTGNIDTDDPDESQVLTKPAGLEEHGGGPKFAVGSRTDKNFRRFLNDYAAVVSDKYKQTDQLPKASDELAVLSGQHLRIIDLPERFHQKLLRADIYRYTDAGWSETRWATAENPIAGKRNMWQSMVMATAPRDSKRAAKIKPNTPVPGGRYLVKIYIDREDKTKKDRDYELGESEFYGQVEFRGEWKTGYQPPRIVHAPSRD